VCASHLIVSMVDIKAAERGRVFFLEHTYKCVGARMRRSSECSCSGCGWRLWRLWDSGEDYSSERALVRPSARYPSMQHCPSSSTYPSPKYAKTYQDATFQTLLRKEAKETTQT